MPISLREGLMRASQEHFWHYGRVDCIANFVAHHSSRNLTMRYSTHHSSNYAYVPTILFLLNCFEIEEFFKIMYVPFEKQASFVMFRLEGFSGLWWILFQKDRKNQEKFPILSWMRMKKEFQARFYFSRIWAKCL